MNRISRLIPLVLLSTVIGCTYVRPPVEGREDPYDRQQIHLASEQLRRDTAVGEPSVSRDEYGNLLYVTVPIRSTLNRNLHVDYRVTFFDRTGQVVHRTGWLTKTLQSRTPDQIRVNSTTDRAADFQVDFRYAR
jgi:hypothetical protein